MEIIQVCGTYYVEKEFSAIVTIDTKRISSDCIDFEEERDQLIRQEVRNHYAPIEGVDELEDIDIHAACQLQQQ